jgi:hypothetical protein
MLEHMTMVDESLSLQVDAGEGAPIILCELHSKNGDLVRMNFSCISEDPFDEGWLDILACSELFWVEGCTWL